MVVLTSRRQRPALNSRSNKCISCSFFNNAPVSDEALQKELAEMATHHPQPVVHIYGDKQVVYERVINVMGMANKAGIEKVGFVTDPGK